MRLKNYQENVIKALEILASSCDLLISAENSADDIVNLSVPNHKLSTQINLLLYLIASFKADSKKALQLHLALMQHLEMFSTKISSKTSYKFLVIPFIFDF